MKKELRAKIIAAISTEYPFSEREVESIYNDTKSLDFTITVCDLSESHNISLQEGRSRLFNALNPRLHTGGPF